MKEIISTLLPSPTAFLSPPSQENFLNDLSTFSVDSSTNPVAL